MNCLTCELVRATAYAALHLAKGAPIQQIADELSAKYGERYMPYVVCRKGKLRHGIKRAIKTPPFDHRIIIEVAHNGSSDGSVEGCEGEGSP